MNIRPVDEVPVFLETQRFRQPWIWVLIIGIAGIAWYSFIRQIIMGDPFGSNPAPDTGLIVILVIFGIIFPVWFLLMKLETEVTSTILRLRMFPLHLKWKEVPFGTIGGVMAVIYRPLREYGGWGIRFGRKGMAYNVSGDRGVQVTLKNGKSFLLGSRKAEELESVLHADNIAPALATRNLLSELRQLGEVTGGPRPFNQRDRSRFLQALDKAVNEIRGKMIAQ